MDVHDVIMIERCLLSRVDPVAEPDLHQVVFHSLIRLEDIRRDREARYADERRRQQLLDSDQNESPTPPPLEMEH